MTLRGRLIAALGTLLLIILLLADGFNRMGTELERSRQALLHAGQVVSRTRILETVWSTDADPLTNAVEVYIRHLRNKLDQGEMKWTPDDGLELVARAIIDQFDVHPCTTAQLHRPALLPDQRSDPRSRETHR